MTRSGAASLDAADVLGALGVGVVVVAPDGRVAYANDAASRLLGVDLADAAGGALSQVLPALAESSELELMRQTLADGRTRSFQTYAPARPGRRAAPGDRHTVGVMVRRTASGTLLLEIGGEGMLPQSAEELMVRELARQMTRLPDSVALLELLLAQALSQSAADGAIVVQLHGDEAAFVTATGSSQPLRGRRVLVSGTPLEEAMRGGEVCALASGTALVGGTEALLDGPALVAPLLAHERMLGALVVVRAAGSVPFGTREQEQLRLIADYTSLALWKARLTEEAEVASQAKSNFLATMSHELRTPLTTLTGYGELLADEILGPMSEVQLEVVERMRAVTHNLTTTIDEILTYSSIEAGQEIVRLRETSSAELARAVHQHLEPVAGQKGLDFGLSITDAPIVRTDADKVRQILVNLAGNGVKFTDHGSVHLSVTRVDDEVRFALRDTGSGISEEDQARLFQPFTQLDGGLTRSHGGTGLGLYISRRLATLVGGRIEVESVPGNGSTFTLVLPIG